MQGGAMQGLHHVGITVKDLDASIRFYHDVLGLEFSNEPSPWFEGDELGKAVGVPGAASLRFGPGPCGPGRVRARTSQSRTRRTPSQGILTPC